MNEREETSRVIEKIRKLLALATSSNEHEASSAADKAQAMLAEYNLSMDEVRATGESKEFFIIDSDTVTDSRPWRRQLAANVARLYFCKYFFTMQYEMTTSRKCGYIRHDAHSFVGAEHNVVVAKMMFEYLNVTVARLARDGSMSVPPKKRASYVTSFQHACALRVVTRLTKRYLEAKAGRVKSESGTNLPALLDLYATNEKKAKDFIESNVGEVENHNRGGRINDEQAAIDGARAGDNISLDQQVGDEKRRQVGQTRLLGSQ